MVDRTAVNVFGAIQQDKLTELLHGDDATAKSGDGFWARFLWIVPEYVFLSRTSTRSRSPASWRQ